MIRKLKIKFVLINMTLLTVLLIGIFTAVYLVIAHDAEKENISIMEKVVQNSSKWENLEKSENISQKEATYRAYMMKTVLFVRLDKDSNITEVGGQFDINEADLTKNISYVLSASENSGIIPDENLSYLIISGEGDKVIAFADRTDEINTLQNLFKTSAYVGSVSLILLICISFFLASWAVKPIETSLQLQRRFVADASHELKTPLTTILANTEIVLSHKAETVDRQIKWLNYIKNEAQRMTGLVNDLLFLAKTDDAAISDVFCAVDLSEIAWTCLLPFESILFEKGKTLKSDIAPDLFVCGNEERLKQLILILLDNAVKYSDEKSMVTVTLKEERDKIKLSVHNTGKPIDERHMPRIFERFYRVDEARARAAGGYGLGLAIAQSIAENHNGKISVNSSMAEGTTFSVLFPVLKYR